MTMPQSFRLGLLPFSDALGGFVAHLYNSTAIRHDPRYSGMFVDGHNSDETDGKAIELDVEGVDPLGWQLCWSLEYMLDTSSHADAGGDLVLPHLCHARAQSSSVRRPHQKQRKHNSSSRRRRRRRGRPGPTWNEQLVAYAAVVTTLQLFLHLARADATALLLPVLSRATTVGCCAREAARVGGAVVALANAAGVLGSALATRRYGRDATCAVSGALVVFCQVAVPAMVGEHAGLTRATSAGHAAALFAAACAVSCGLSWAWGALFWAVPGPGDGEGIRSVAGAALGLAQMQCSLLTLRQLKHAALAYYAVRIWS